MNDKLWIILLLVWLLFCMSVDEIRNKEVRTEIKETLELVKKAQELCSEATK